MNRNKVVIVVLVVIAALYLVSLAMGIHFNVESTSEPSDNEVENSWIKYLGDPLSIFAPKLLRCNGQPVDEPFVLTEKDRRCEVEIPGSSEPQIAKLKVLGTGVTVYERSDSLPRKPDCKSDRQLKSGLKVKVEYLPEGRARRMPDCWLERSMSRPLSLVVLGDGGQLTLTCEGCNASARRVVRLRLGD